MPSKVPCATALGGASAGYRSSPRTIRMIRWREEPAGPEAARAYLPHPQKGLAGVEPVRAGPGLHGQHVRPEGLTVPEARPERRLKPDGRQMGNGAVRGGHVRGQDGLVGLAEDVPRHGLLQPEAADSCPLESLEVGSRAEGLAEVVGQAPDVGARSAGDSNGQAR